MIRRYMAPLKVALVLVRPGERVRALPGRGQPALRGARRELGGGPASTRSSWRIVYGLMWVGSLWLIAPLPAAHALGAARRDH